MFLIFLLAPRSLEPVLSLSYRTSNNLTNANSIIAREVESFLSQFFQSLLHFSNHAKDLSTTQRFGITANL